ncbi:hypothetical protein M422DRAFT_64284 [Sphaerobolus stellatus SS14]|nr:hypothetical protein M422DRAFT_64284 [Sphaerobolus stellatus SS14]
MVPIPDMPAHYSGIKARLPKPAVHRSAFHHATHGRGPRQLEESSEHSRFSLAPSIEEAYPSSIEWSAKPFGTTLGTDRTPRPLSSSYTEGRSRSSEYILPVSPARDGRVYDRPENSSPLSYYSHSLPRSNAYILDSLPDCCLETRHYVREANEKDTRNTSSPSGLRLPPLQISHSGLPTNSQSILSSSQGSLRLPPIRTLEEEEEVIKRHKGEPHLSSRRRSREYHVAAHPLAARFHPNEGLQLAAGTRTSRKISQVSHQNTILNNQPRHEDLRPNREYYPDLQDQFDELLRIDSHAIPDLERKGLNSLPEFGRNIRPNLTWTQMISAALLGSPRNRLRLKDIQRAISLRFSFFANIKPYNNTIRHNLSMAEEFEMREATDGKGHWWTYVGPRSHRRGRKLQSNRNDNELPLHRLSPSLESLRWSRNSSPNTSVADLDDRRTWSTTLDSASEDERTTMETSIPYCT